MSILIARRYAKAFFEIAADEKKTDTLFKDFSTVKEIYLQSGEFRGFISNPIISVEKKIEVVSELFRKNVDKLTLKCLLFLTTKMRLELVLLICTEFENYYLQSKNILRATIQSKVKLSATQIEHICDKFRKSEEKEVESRSKLDETMLGGFKVKINDTVYDYSIESKLNKFKESVTH